MSDIPHLVNQLKQQLKQQQITYLDVARQLGLSEASVKRLFANQGFSLQRLEQICHMLGATLSDLIIDAEHSREKVAQLSLQQEQEIVSDEKLLLVTYLVLNHWSFPQIQSDYQFEVPELIKLMVRLDRMQIIELLPNNKIRLLTSRDFRWIKSGPIEKFVLKNVKNAFLNARFNQPSDMLKFISGVISPATMSQISKKLEKTEREINQLIENDAKLPLNEREGFSVLVASRFWDFAGFAQFKR